MNLDFSGCNILVIGDIMLDEYIVGNDYRISDEAPVPILKVDEFKVYLGGAANVAHNISTMGGNVVLSGVIGGGMGEIRHGYSYSRLMNLFEESHLSNFGIVASDGLTTTKSRIIINGCQVARYDYEQVVLRKVTQKRIHDRLNLIDFNKIDLIIVSDYNKGVITAEIMDLLKSNNVQIIVDPKPGNESLYNNVSYITPNIKEFMLMINETDKRRVTSNLLEHSKKFVQDYNIDGVIITMGEEGLYYYQNEQNNGTVCRKRKEVSNIIGAGDTLVSAMALSLCAGNSIIDALEFASFAAGIVVSKRFTSTCTMDDINEFQKIS